MKIVSLKIISKLHSKKWLFLMTVAVFSVGALLAYQGQRGRVDKTGSQPVSYKTDFKKEQTELATRFTSSSARVAYDYFKQSYASYDPLHRHYLGHFVGVKIYELEDENGITLCDSNFEFGCVHGFIMSGVEKEGKDFLRRVQQSCHAMTDHVSVEKCIHGLGHGIASYYGYTREGLLTSLSSCKEVSPAAPAICYNGVFMEYNLRPMNISDIGTFSGRKLDSAKPLEPCDTLPDEFASDCYIELGSWWSNVITGKYDLMGSYCQTVAEPRARENCFSGVGRTLTDVNQFNLSKISQGCDQMPSAQGEAWCLMGAMGVMITEDQSNALDLCRYAEPEYRDSCTRWGEEFKCHERGVCP